MPYYNTTTNMNYPLPGPSAVSEYLVSAIPWVTSSNIVANTTVRVSFDNVTSFFTIKNVSATNTTLKIAFTENGFRTSNYFTLSGSDAFSADLRVKDLFFSSTQNIQYEIIAGVTTIPASNFPTLTGSLNLAANSMFVPNIG